MGDLLKLKLGDICQFKAGDAFKKDMQGRSFGNYPFIKVSDMNLAGNEIFITRAGNWVSESDVTERRFTAHQPGSIVFAKIGIALTYNRRRILRLPTIIDNNMMAATPDAKKVNERYFYYLLRTLDFNEISSGSALPYLTQKDLAEIDVALHPLPEQESIDATLSALDDKIELNRRMNETLEAMARALFKDWFVDFGPTRAKMEGRDPYLVPEMWDLFPDSLDGEGKPVGWEIKPLDKIAEFLNGLALQKFPALDPEDSLPVIKIAELRGGITGKSNRASHAIPEEYIVKDGDFLFSWSGSLMAKFWTEGEGALNQHLFKVTSDRYPEWFFSQWVRHHLEEFQAIAASKATTMGHIQRGHLKEAMTNCPPDDLLSILGRTAGPLVEHIINNERENRTLAETRDLLLPKLMSGEIRVSDADKIVQEFT